MAKSKTPKRRRLAPVAPPVPLVQVMPGGRVRLDPTVIRELTAWVLTYANRYHSKASKTIRGLKGAVRARTVAERHKANDAVGVLMLFAACLTETLNLADVESSLRLWDGVRPGVPAPPPLTPRLHTPGIPGTE